MNGRVKTRSARVVQALWAALAVAGITVSLVSIPSQWKTSDTICHTAAACSGSGQLDASAARSLSHYGISLSAFAVYNTAIVLAIVAIFYGLGALIIWRKPEDRGAILAAFFLVVFPLLIINNFALPWIFAALILFGLLFPDGRFAPRWTRWLALAAIIACISDVFADGPATLATLVLMLPIPFLQVYRFRSLSSWAERQRTKWALLGLAAAISGFIAIITSFSWAPWQTGYGTLYNAFTGEVAFPFFISAIPITLAMSVLHSRLWDIDRIISRALVYASLTAALAGIYIGGVIGLQALFRVVIGSGSAPAIAISTLAIVALFGPLRRRIQVVIDRRFYRSRYDAAKTLSAFGERLRDQVELAHLSQDLTTVVHDTLHPEHVSLWLRDAGRAPVGAGGTADR